jgi:hypothetical protein
MRINNPISPLSELNINDCSPHMLQIVDFFKHKKYIEGIKAFRQILTNF